jgi:type IV secretion system protein VirD4
MGIADRFRRVWDEANGQQQDPLWEQLETSHDALGYLVSQRMVGDTRYRLPVGFSKGSYLYTRPRNQVLVLGPPQGAGGKTSGILIPALLSHLGPAVATTTKWDVPQATALAQARKGDVWWYDPSGGPTPPGFKELRWNPIVGSEDWTAAREIAKQISPECIAMLTGILNTDSRERSGYFTSAATTWRGYQGDALRVAENVNFDPLAFVLGKPNENSYLYVQPRGQMQELLGARGGLYPRLIGRFDTVYISMPVEKQQMYGPQLNAYVGALRRAAYAVAAEDQRRGLHGRMPLLLCLDEMYGSPVPDLPQLLAEGASQGLIILGALQDLAQAKARWGKAADGFLTLWGYVSVMRNIRDRETLDLLSQLGGEYDHPTTNFSQSHGNWGMWSESRGHERRRRLPVDVISHGDPAHQGEELLFGPDGWQYVRPLRYFQAPWAPTLIQSAEWALKRPGIPKALPLPDLARGGDYRGLYAIGGSGYVDWMKEIQAKHRQAQLAA